MRDERKATVQHAQQMDFNILGCIPDDENIAKCDMVGKPLLKLPDDSPSVLAVENIVRGMGVATVG